MITVAGLVPHPPLLLRELGGAQDSVGDLRAACLTTVRGLLTQAETLAVVGGGDSTRRCDPAAAVDVRRFGTCAPRSSGPSLPLSVGVGMRLLDEAGWDGPVAAHSLAPDVSADALDRLAADLAAGPGHTAVLVLGDGSARRGEKAPGYLDERAFPFDDAVAKALADGEAAELAALDVQLADELMVLGASALRFLGTLAMRQSRRPAATLTYRGDPFGVTYLTATWRFA